LSVITKFIPYKIKTFFKKFRKFNALNNLDQKLLKYLNFESGFYIECGANDGINQSNSWYFDKYKNWKGILIEPIPRLFKELKNNRNCKNIFINKYLVSEKYSKEYIYITDKNLASKIEKNSSLKVEVSTLNKILKENNAPKIINLFSLDVEGYEFEVLEGINFSKYKFEFILIETNKSIKLKKYLQNKSYLFIKELSDGDFLFKYNK
jgi:FkbM family methyltransferase